MHAISAWYGFLNKSHLADKIIFSSVLSSTDILNQLLILNSYKLQDYDDKLQPVETVPCIICFPSACYNLRTLGHGLSITVTMLNLNSTKRHLSID